MKSTPSHFPLPEQLIRELKERAIALDYIPNTDIIRMKKGKHHAFAIQGFLPTIPYTFGLLVNNKLNTAAYLKMKNIPVLPKCPVNVHPQSITEVMGQIGLPVIVKYESSLFLGRSSGAIRKQYDLQEVVERMSQDGQPLFAEQYREGSIYSVFISSEGYIHVLKESCVKQFHPSQLDISGNRDVVNTMQLQEVPTDTALRKQLRSLGEKLLKLFNPPYLTFKILQTQHGERTQKSIFVLELYHTATQHFGYEATVKKNQKPVEAIVADAIEKQMSMYAST